jgi:hypothetical protein
MSVKHVKNGIRPSMSTDYEKEINKIDSEIRKLLNSKKKLKVRASKKRKKEQAVKYRAKKKQQLINKQGMGYHPDEYHTQYAVNVDNIHVMNMWDNPRCTYRVGGWYKSRDYNFCEKKHKLVHKGDELSLYNLEDINM